MQAALPLNIDGFFYTGDADTGMRRTAANTQVITAGAVDVVEVTPVGMDITGALLLNGATILPVGLGPLPWSGLTAPPKWVLAYGQSLLRSAYPDFWTFASGEIAGGNTLYTNGDGSTTFTVPDLRGRLPAGKDNMGGSPANRLTTGFFGSSPNTLGNVGGGQTNALVTANLPPYTPAGTVSTPTITSTSNVPATTGAIGNSTPAGGGSTFVPSSNVGFSQATFASTTPTFTGTAQGGTSSSFSVVQPAIITNFIIYAGA